MVMTVNQYIHVPNAVKRWLNPLLKKELITLNVQLERLIAITLLWLMTKVILKKNNLYISTKKTAIYIAVFFVAFLQTKQKTKTHKHCLDS